MVGSDFYQVNFLTKQLWEIQFISIPRGGGGGIFKHFPCMQTPLKTAWQLGPPARFDFPSADGILET